PHPPRGGRAGRPERCREPGVEPLRRVGVDHPRRELGPVPGSSAGVRRGDGVAPALRRGCRSHLVPQRGRFARPREGAAAPVARQLTAQATRSSSARTAKASYWRARMLVRPATPEDRDALWRIIEPVLRAGETYALPRDWGKAEALEYWMAPAHEVF